jgi:hypothetical protein
MGDLTLVCPLAAPSAGDGAVPCGLIWWRPGPHPFAWLVAPAEDCPRLARPTDRFAPSDRTPGSE